MGHVRQAGTWDTLLQCLQLGTPLLQQQHTKKLGSVQFSSVTQSGPTLHSLMNCGIPGLPVHHQLPEFTQTHVH